MATTSITHNRLRYSKGSVSPATSGAAYQGFQGGSSTAYRYSGDMRFTSPALGSAVNITAASVTLTFAAIGGVYTKGVGLQWSKADGTPYQVTDVTSCYNTTKTISFNSTLLPYIANAAKTSGNITIGLYRTSINNYQSDKKWDYNYLKVTTAKLNLTYNYTSNIQYYDGSTWKQCIPYYYDGSAWKQCQAYYYDGSAWKQC